MISQHRKKYSVASLTVNMALERLPSVSGMFYPEEKEQLEGMIRQFMHDAEPEIPEGRILGVIVPHAGYFYSGKTAAYAFKSVDFKERKIMLIGPNHDSYPFYSAVFPGGPWKTPLGESVVDADEVNRIADSARILVKDGLAHSREHSLEVQIPFLQFATENRFSFVPVILGDQSEDTVGKLADALLPAIPDYVIIASSDLNHYERRDITEFKDAKLIDAILSLNVSQFYRAIHEHRATPCGYGAIATLMIAAKRANGKIVLLNHTTSAEASGDATSVVGYAAMIAVK